MYINGIEFRTDKKFKVKTELGMKYYQSSDNNYYSVDRGSESDIYGCEIATFGTETYINNIVNLVSSGNVLVMSGFADNEKIFGEDIDYTVISGVVIDIGIREQNSFKGFALKLELEALSPSFSSTPVLPTWSNVNIQIGYNGYVDFNKNTYHTYFADVYSYNELDANGIFKGDFNLTNIELGNLRRWISYNRDLAFSINSLYGVEYPFGPTEGTGPWNVKIIDLKEKASFGLSRTITELTIVKDY